MNTARIAETIAAQLPPHIAADVAKELLNVTKPRCKVDGCDGKIHGYGYCGTHYFRLLRANKLPERRATAPRRCVVSGCKQKHHARGYCKTHYFRWKRTGSPYIANGRRVECNRLPTPDTLPVATCQVDGCGGPMQASGMCWKHYQRERRKGDA